MANELKIRLFGDLEVSTAGKAISLPKSKKARAALGCLGLSPEGASRNSLCSLLFPGVKDPRASLRWVINQLRNVLPGDESFIISQGDLLLLDSLQVKTDTDELNRALVESASWNPAEGSPAAVRVSELTQLVLGIEDQLLDNLQLANAAEFESWRQTEQFRYRQKQQQLISNLIHAQPAIEHRIALGQKLVRLDSLNETAWASYVSVLTRAGYMQEAQRVYDLARQTLTQDQLSLTGELEQAFHLNRSNTQAPSPPNEHQASPLRHGGSAARHRYTLAVMPCTAEPEHDLTPATLNLITSAVTTAANANRACVVMARSISQNVARTSVNAQSVGQQIGADLVLDTNVRRIAPGFELSLELIEVTGGTCIYNWQHAFTAQQDESNADAAAVFFSARFELDIQIAMIGLAATKSQAELRLWDRYFLALPRIYTPQGHDPNQSLEMLQAVIDEEPSMGPAAAMAAWVRTTHPQYNEDPADIAVTIQLARRAVELCQDDTLVIGIAAVVIATTEGDLETAHELVTRALTFNPSSTMGLIALGLIEHYLGHHERAIKILEQTENAIDTEPLTFIIRTYRALSLFLLGRSEAGLPLAQKACGRNPTFVIARRALTLCLVGTGQIDAAQHEAQHLQEMDPTENLSFYKNHLSYRNPVDLEKILADATLAGIRENRSIPLI